MTLALSLPPQFLLPAWNARQLANSVHRAHICDTRLWKTASWGRQKPGSGSKNHDEPAQDNGNPYLQQPPSIHATAQELPRGSRRDSINNPKLPSSFRTSEVLTQPNISSHGRVAGSDTVMAAKKILSITTKVKSQEMVSPSLSGCEPALQSKEYTMFPPPPIDYEKRLQPLPTKVMHGSFPTNNELPSPPQYTRLGHLNQTELGLIKRDKRLWGKGKVDGKFSESRLVDGKTPVCRSLASCEPVSQPEPEEVQPMSLFEELFPEERIKPQTTEQEVQNKLERLPAFQWTASQQDRQVCGQMSSQRTTERQQGRVNIRTEQTQSPRLEVLPENQATVLRLTGCSSSFEESDFLRLGTKGNHIQDWTTGIIKVIPGRSRRTLQSQSNYFILFSSTIAAVKFREKINELRSISRRHRKTGSLRITVPRGDFAEDDDGDNPLIGYSLVPEYATLTLQSLHRPYNAGVQNILNGGSPVAILRRRAKTEHLVLFSLDMSNISINDLRRILSDDGRRRNLHWKLAGGYDALMAVDGNPILSESHRQLLDASRPLYQPLYPMPTSYHGPSRYVVPFMDQCEARRFVREWHRRPLPLSLAQDVTDIPPTASVEILW